MAFDEISREHRRCPCGSGTYLIVQRMDDWNRTDETWTMECSGCATSYSLITRHSHSSGMPCALFRWAPKGLLPAIERVQQKLAQRLEFVTGLIATRYRDQMHDRLRGMSKKAAWQLVRDDHGYPALQTFYKHVRESSLEATINAYLNSSNGAALVVRVFGATDVELAAAVRDVDELERELEARRGEVFRQSFA